MRNSHKTVTTRETVWNWMACTSADRVTAPGKYTGVPVQVCRQGHCARQVHRRASTGLQTGPILQASTQACRGAGTGLQIVPLLQASTQVHPQNVRFQNVRFQNVRFQNVRFQNVRNVRYTKHQLYKTSGLQNVRFTKRQVFKTSGCKKIHIYSVLVVGGNLQILLQPCLQAK
jgi:hypothetical protein